MIGSKRTTSGFTPVVNESTTGFTPVVNESTTGFTLLELIVVIAIIGVLAALIVPNFMAARVRARDSAKKVDLRNLKQALQMYYNDYQSYPPGTGSGVSYNNIPGCGIDGDTNCSGSFQTANTTYMKQLPTSSYRYYYDNPNDTFILRVELENASDEDLQASQSICNSSCPSTNANCCTPSGSELYYCVCPD